MTKQAYNSYLATAEYLKTKYREVATRYMKLYYNREPSDWNDVNVDETSIQVVDDYMFYEIPLDYMWEPEETFEARVLEEKSLADAQQELDNELRRLNEEKRLYQDYLKLKDHFETNTEVYNEED